MFLGQTFIKSLRDQGYNTTTSALCEFVDNSFQWGATEVRVYITQGKRDKAVRILVVDNGRGMSQAGLQVAMSFGGSMAYEARTGISRFGMGMKTAGLSISPIYRRFIAQGKRLHVNNRLVEAFDQTYQMPTARHTQVEGLTETRSRLIFSRPIDVPIADGSPKTTRVTVRRFALPFGCHSGPHNPVEFGTGLQNCGPSTHVSSVWSKWVRSGMTTSTTS
jgi:hypothetical protein